MKTSILFLAVIFTLNLSFAQNYETIQNKNFKITKLDQLNSDSRETNLCITPDGKYLFYMSDRGGQEWSVRASDFKGKTSYDGDIWFSKKVNGKWTKGKPLSSTINTFSGEDEPNISPDGQKVYFESWRTWWSSTGGPYYYAEANGKDWGTPVGMGSGINDFFNEEYNNHYGYATDGMAISPDGKTFIVACGEDYDGNLDFYISHLKSEAWTYPKKMHLSTEQEERSIFIAGDNHTIYFGSAGYGGFGGIDIFKGYLNDNGSVTNITNVGEPFNSAKDDYGFIITGDGKEAYFVRDGDIYMATLNKKNELAPGASVVISGTISDCKNNFLKTELFLQKQKSTTKINTTSSSNGKFIFSFPAENGKYDILNDKNVVLKTIEVKTNNNFTEYANIKLTDCSIIVPSSKAAEKH